MVIADRPSAQSRAFLVRAIIFVVDFVRKGMPSAKKARGGSRYGIDLGHKLSACSDLVPNRAGRRAAVI